jgi:alkylation response protein AidB-like acyl-CoA dehydrogenase
VSFSETPILPDAVIGTGEIAKTTLAHAELHAIAALCAEGVGIAQFLLDETLAYVKLRRQFGQPIGRFQAIQHRIVDMYVAVEEARSLSLMAAINLESNDSGQRAHALAAAKIGVLSRALHVARESIQLHGGIGMTEDLPLGAGLRRLMAMKVTYGDEAIQLDRMVPGIVSGIYTAPDSK